MIIIDRFEGQFAICGQDGKWEQIERIRLPEGCKEGDCLELREGVYQLQRDQTQQKRAKAKERMEKLFKRND